MQAIFLQIFTSTVELVMLSFFRLLDVLSSPCDSCMRLLLSHIHRIESQLWLFVQKLEHEQFELVRGTCS